MFLCCFVVSVDQARSEAVRVEEMVEAGGFGNAMYEGWGSVATDARSGPSSVSTDMFWVSGVDILVVRLIVIVIIIFWRFLGV